MIEILKIYSLNISIDVRKSLQTIIYSSEDPWKFEAKRSKKKLKY